MANLNMVLNALAVIEFQGVFDLCYSRLSLSYSLSQLPTILTYIFKCLWQPVS